MSLLYLGNSFDVCIQHLEEMQKGVLPKSCFPGCITNLRLLCSLLLDDVEGSTYNRPGIWLLGGAAPLLDSLSMDIL